MTFGTTLVVKTALFLLNAAIATAILDLISQVHLPSIANMLPKYLKDFTFSFLGLYPDTIRKTQQSVLIRDVMADKCKKPTE